MNIFFEKEFIENFEIEFEEKRYSKYSNVWNSLYDMFTTFPNIKWFVKIDNELKNEDIIYNSEILSKLSDINLNHAFIKSIKETLSKERSAQTLVFTEKKQEWITDFKNSSILFFDYENLEKDLNSFLENTNVFFDFSFEKEKFTWDYFNFISSEENNFVFISDPYIIGNKSNQKIKDNVSQLLKVNLPNYKMTNVFILTELTNKNIKEATQILNRELANLNVKIFLINILKEIETMDFHDRFLYTNYTITRAGKGFIINTNKDVNTSFETKSIFDKNTYMMFKSHMGKIQKYIKRLEKRPEYIGTQKIMKTNNERMFYEFYSLNFE